LQDLRGELSAACACSSDDGDIHLLILAAIGPTDRAFTTAVRSLRS
jgi:hypothetical protein